MRLAQPIAYKGFARKDLTSLIFRKVVMSIRDDVENMREVYFGIVKPAIEGRRYAEAGSEFQNAFFLLEDEAVQVKIQVHCGAGLMLAGKRLCDLLLADEPPEQRAVERFEMYLAQTKLPKERLGSQKHQP